MDSDEEPRVSKRFRFAGVTEEKEFHEEKPTRSAFRKPEKGKTKRKSSHKVLTSEAEKKRLEKEETKRKKEESETIHWSYDLSKLSRTLRSIEPIVVYNSLPNTSIEPSKLVDEVYHRETLKDWLERTKAVDEAGGRWPVDYIITTEKGEAGREIGEFKYKDNPKADPKEWWKVLVKWSHLPVPTWDQLKLMPEKAFAEFVLRSLYHDFVEIDIREKKTEDFFNENFEHRYLPFEKGTEQGGYIEDERALYQGKLRAIEHHCTTVNAREGRPPLYIADWTDRPFGDVELLENLVKCPNHLKSLLLRGCTAPMLFFRFPRRGWTFRALTEFKKNSIIAQSVREIPTSEVIPPPKASSTSRNDTAEDSDSNTDEEDDATKNAAQIKKDANSYRKEDDLRYMHHQCDPNTFYETEIMNSDYRNDDKVIQRVALRAARDIKRGEELTYDRYEGKVPRMLHQEKIDVFEEFLPDGCPCRQTNCRFTVQLINKFRKYLKANEEDKEKTDRKLTRMEEQGDAYKSSSDEDDDEEAAANGGNDDEEREEQVEPAPLNGLEEEDDDGPQGRSPERDDDEALLGAEGADGADDETGTGAAANLRKKKVMRSDAENDFELNLDA